MPLRANISRTEWSFCLSLLRTARATILRDAEAFQESATTLEHIGQCISGEVRTSLYKYEKDLTALAARAGDNARNEAARLLPLVRDARNMAVHEGAWARHVSTRLVDLFLILEEAIMTHMNTVEDIMVRGPLVAESWQTAAHVRRAMLANSFSALPILVNNEWHLLTDAALMRYLSAASSKDERRERLAKQIGQLIAAGAIVSSPAVCCSPATTIPEIVSRMKTESTVLVTELETKPARLLGIVTAFDLL